MARAPDPRIEQAKAMYLQGMKLVEIASQLSLPEGTVRRWKCTHKWENERSGMSSDKKTNVRIRKKEAVNREIKMRPVRREIRMQLRQESLKLSFLIVWIQMNNN